MDGGFENTVLHLGPTYCFWVSEWTVVIASIICYGALSNVVGLANFKSCNAVKTKSLRNGRSGGRFDLNSQ